MDITDEWDDAYEMHSCKEDCEVINKLAKIDQA
jgi:hypothetical protein